ncbi:hypothetical protein AXG93_625s1070 [Marchantia polymorpha subsp. ruderalis]|uniref:Uncharacterized protein n=1 Tax=Marchantia polymorpha subsp. ruderalis TaxID=1480154 RepID=A0A176VC79_MARPO|nr:hypothetical protein AXG93_625s1070 [Marchantia polymorpha subsp. ruderalis]
MHAIGIYTLWSDRRAGISTVVNPVSGKVDCGGERVGGPSPAGLTRRQGSDVHVDLPRLPRRTRRLIWKVKPLYRCTECERAKQDPSPSRSTLRNPDLVQVSSIGRRRAWAGALSVDVSRGMSATTMVPANNVSPDGLLLTLTKLQHRSLLDGRRFASKVKQSVVILFHGCEIADSLSVVLRQQIAPNGSTRRPAVRLGEKNTSII